MRMIRLFPLVLIISCTEGKMSEPNASRNAHQPVAPYRLSAEDRARIAPSFDADSLEEFLQGNAPKSRAALLRKFQEQPAIQVNSVNGELTVPDISVLTHVSDPVLNEKLDKVWAAKWAHLSLEELERADQKRPGVKTALALKRAMPGNNK